MSSKHPLIVEVTPRLGVPGGEVAIRCRDFKPDLPSCSKVMFDEAAADIISASDELVVARIPREALGPGVRLLSDGESSSVFPFTVALTLASGLHPVTNPVVAPNGSIITTISGSRGQQVAEPLVRVTDENLISEAWRTDVMALIAAPDHRFATAAGAIDVRLLNDEILIVREPGSGTREVVAQALAAHRVEPQRTLEIGSTEAIKQAVAAGVGVAIVSVATIDDQVRLGKLKVIPVKGVRIERTLWQLRSPGRLDVPAAVAFEGIIRETQGAKAAPHTPSAKARRTNPAPTQRHARS